MKEKTIRTEIEFLEKTSTNDYHISLSIKNEIEKVFKALTSEIPHWWTKNFNGTADVVNETFTVKFGTTFKTMKVLNLVPNKKVVWECIETLIDLPELPNNTEWKGTKVVWNLYQQAKETKILLTHFGLTPQVACYEICERGWQSFLESLKTYVETGQGMPYDD